MRRIDADDFGNRMYHEVFEKDSEDQRWDSGCWMRYKLFERVLREQPTVPQWIPVTERLPEESDDYLCSYGTLTGHFVGIDIYEAEKKEFGFYSDDEQGNEVWHHVKNVVAWMPIPKPWKGEQDG